MIKTDRQLANTRSKLQQLREQIAKAHARPATPERDVSIGSLESLARQLEEEIVRYRSHVKLKNAG